MIVNALLRGRSLIEFKNLENCDLVLLANDTNIEIEEIDGFKEYLNDKEIHLVFNMVLGAASGYHHIQFFDNFNVTKLIRPYIYGDRLPGSSGQGIPLEDNFLGNHHKKFMFTGGRYSYDYPGTGIAAIAYAILDCEVDILNIVGLDFYDNLNYGKSNYLVADVFGKRDFGSDVGDGLSEEHIEQVKLLQIQMQNTFCELVEHKPNMQVNLSTKCKSFIDRMKNIKNLNIKVIE